MSGRVAVAAVGVAAMVATIVAVASRGSARVDDPDRVEVVAANVTPSVAASPVAVPGATPIPVTTTLPAVPPVPATKRTILPVDLSAIESAADAEAGEVDRLPEPTVAPAGF